MNSVISKLLFLVPPILRLATFIVYLSIIVYGSLTSSSKVPKLFTFHNADKVVHFLMYLGFCIIGLWSIDFNRKANSRDNTLKRSKYFSILIMAIVWGILMEIFQRYLATGRHFSYYDLLANILGALTGIAVYYKITH